MKTTYAHHADVIPVKQDLWKFLLIAGIIAGCHVRRILTDVNPEKKKEEKKTYNSVTSSNTMSVTSVSVFYHHCWTETKIEGIHTDIIIKTKQSSCEFCLYIS